MIGDRNLRNRAVDPATLRDRDGLDYEDAPRLSPSALAAYWGVHKNTVLRDIRKGALPAMRVGAGRQFRIRPSDARRYGRPVD